jgi:hypothetical protein
MNTQKHSCLTWSKEDFNGDEQLMNKFFTECNEMIIQSINEMKETWMNDRELTTEEINKGRELVRMSINPFPKKYRVTSYRDHLYEYNAHGEHRGYVVEAIDQSSHTWFFNDGRISHRTGSVLDLGITIK